MSFEVVKLDEGALIDRFSDYSAVGYSGQTDRSACCISMICIRIMSAPGTFLPLAAHVTKVRLGPKVPVVLIRAKVWKVRLADIQQASERRDAANGRFETVAASTYRNEKTRSVSRVSVVLPFDRSV